MMPGHVIPVELKAAGTITTTYKCVVILLGGPGAERCRYALFVCCVGKNGTKQNQMQPDRLDQRKKGGGKEGLTFFFLL